MLTRESIDDPYHVEIIRENLMRNLSAVFPDMIDELAVAVPDCIPINSDGTCCFQAIGHGSSSKRFMLSRMDDGEGIVDNAEGCGPLEQPSLCRASSMCVSALEPSRV